MNKDLLRRRFTDSGAGPRGTALGPVCPGAGGAHRCAVGACPPRPGGSAALLRSLDFPSQHRLRLLPRAPHPHHPLQRAPGDAHSLHRPQHGEGPPPPAGGGITLRSLPGQYKLLASREASSLFISQKPIVLRFTGGGTSVQGSIVLSFSLFLMLAAVCLRDLFHIARMGPLRAQTQPESRSKTVSTLSPSLSSSISSWDTAC